MYTGCRVQVGTGVVCSFYSVGCSLHTTDAPRARTDRPTRTPPRSHPWRRGHLSTFPVQGDVHAPVGNRLRPFVTVDSTAAKVFSVTKRSKRDGYSAAKKLAVRECATDGGFHAATLHAMPFVRPRVLSRVAQHPRAAVSGQDGQHGRSMPGLRPRGPAGSAE